MTDIMNFVDCVAKLGPVMRFAKRGSIHELLVKHKERLDLALRIFTVVMKRVVSFLWPLRL